MTTYKIKPLKWVKKPNGEYHGKINAIFDYCITNKEEGEFHLFNQNFKLSFETSLKEAKNYASRHYNLLIKQCLLKIPSPR